MLKGLNQKSLMAAFGPPPRDVVRTGGVPVPLRVFLCLLVAGGQPALGTIVAKEERKGKGRGLHRIISYRYPAGDGSERMGTMDVSIWDFEPAQIGQSVVVFYDAASSKSVI